MAGAECLFCRVANRSLPAEIVAEADGLLAFKDLNPQAPVHLLIIPTEHIPSLIDVQNGQTALIGKAVGLANRLARQFGLDPSGYRLVINCGPEAGQSVPHLHLHLLGGRRLQWPPG